MPSVRSQDLYEQAKDIALHVYANYERMADFTNGALFYHADYVNPRWRGWRVANQPLSGFLI